MGLLLPVLVASTLPQLLLCVVPPGSLYQATIHQVEGKNRIFSGENARFNCSIQEGNGFSWSILWYRGDEYLQQTEELVLWQARIQQSGNYSCQGMRDSPLGPLHTLKSRPIEMHVDGGWAILEVPPHPLLVGDTLTVTCRVRGKPPLVQVILYRDGVEVMRQRGSSPHLHFSKVTVKDRGLYTCRATWDSRRRSNSLSVESVATQVSVLEILEEPSLEVGPSRLAENIMKLQCHVQYNAPAPAPPLVYYFYMNGYRLTPAASENQVTVTRAFGDYHCKAMVPLLGLERLSQTKVAGLEQGQAPPPPVFQLPAQASKPLKPRAKPDHVETIVQPTDRPTTQARHQPISDIPWPTTIPHISDETVQPNIHTATPETLEMSGDSPDCLEPITDLP